MRVLIGVIYILIAIIITLIVAFLFYRDFNSFDERKEK
jgi:uncharacterized membrane protein YdjX (TVP38/TMEM64 family)